MNNRNSDIYRDLNNVRRYLKEHKGYVLISEAVIPQQYKTDVETDIDEFEELLQGKAMLKVEDGKSHSLDGITVAFKGSLVLNNLEYNFVFNINEQNPLISMSNGQNILPLTTDLIQVFSICVQYFADWKSKWNTIINNKN